MRSCFLILVLLSIGSKFTFAADKRVGQVFVKLGDKKPRMRFHSERTLHSKGSIYEATFRGLDKKVIVKEVSSYDAGNKLIEYTVTQNQYGCQARIIKKGSKYQLSTKINGTLKSKVILSNAEQIFSGYGVERLIAKKWKALQSGQLVNFIFYPGCNVKPTITLELRKVKPREIGGRTFIAIESGSKNSKKKGVYYYDSNKRLHAYSGPLQVILGSSPDGAILF